MPTNQGDDFQQELKRLNRRKGPQAFPHSFRWDRIRVFDKHETLELPRRQDKDLTTNSVNTVPDSSRPFAIARVAHTGLPQLEALWFHSLCYIQYGQASSHLYTRGRPKTQVGQFGGHQVSQVQVSVLPLGVDTYYILCALAN